MVKVRCEVRESEGQCLKDATVLRRSGDYDFALCDTHRLLPSIRLHLNFPDPVALYHRIHPRRNGA